MDVRIYRNNTISEERILMTKPIKAVMLSALVFPGAGHLFLKKYVSGTVFAGITVASLYFIISRTVERALEIVDKIQRGEVQLDIAAITELVSKQPADANLLNFTWTVLIIAWVIAIGDSYRVGRGQAKNDVIDSN
ncbi:MAG: hypothetical protein ACERLB_07605 [Gammaproteobacteria bacterium]